MGTLPTKLKKLKQELKDLKALEKRVQEAFNAAMKNATRAPRPVFANTHGTSWTIVQHERAYWNDHPGELILLLTLKDREGRISRLCLDHANLKKKTRDWKNWTVTIHDQNAKLVNPSGEVLEEALIIGS